MVYLGDLVAIMEERDFDRDSLESEVMELICSYIYIYIYMIEKKKKRETVQIVPILETENRVRVDCQM